MASSPFRVFLAATTGRVSGVDTFSANLVRGLVGRGVQAEILLTEPHEPLSDLMPFPADVPVTRLGARALGWWQRWKAMIAFLERHAPCVYVPNYDWFYSCVSPRLSARVGVVGIVHSDDPMHYEHVARLGARWNAIVCVSQAILARTAELDASFRPRLHRIPYGVQVPPVPPPRSAAAGAPLRIAYAGRLVIHQKRCMDLAATASELARRGVPFELRIAGAGDDGPALRQACAELERSGAVRFLGTLPNDAVLEQLEQSDVFLLPSDFEGLPVCLLEAMGRACVPVVADSPSGIPELVQDGVNGYRVPIGAIGAFADRLEALQRDPVACSRLGRRAWETALRGGFRLEDMVDAYAALFERVMGEAAEGGWRRPPGPILPPANLAAEVTWRRRIPFPVRRVGRYAGRAARFARRVPGGLVRRARRVLA